MVNEVLGYLDPKPGEVIVDCTVGAGGHSKSILEKIIPRGQLIGLDVDSQILEIAEERLKDFKDNVVLRQANFRQLDNVLSELGINKVDGLLFDLGVSSYQLESPERGFSFNLDGPLDMRMGPDCESCATTLPKKSGKSPRRWGARTAAELINFLTKEELADIIFKFGEERYSRRIAEAIVRERKIQRIETTGQLKSIVLKAIPKTKKWQKIHPATRTFQALRIATNDELAALEEGINLAIKFLKPQARICVISFHSLEDRIVKNIFREADKNGILKILTKKPVCPQEEESSSNPRARSAKLRAAFKIGGDII